MSEPSHPERAPAVVAAVAFGSNLGDRRRHIDLALSRLAEEPGVVLLRRSSICETAPVGGPPQGPFLNGVVLLESVLEPRTLLRRLLAIEQRGGRVRNEINAPRTIDLDLIFCGDEVIDQEGCQVPHPRAHRRGFVLEPLAEVAPDWIHPRLQQSARRLLEAWRSRASACAS